MSHKNAKHAKAARANKQSAVLQSNRQRWQAKHRKTIEGANEYSNRDTCIVLDSSGDDFRSFNGTPMHVIVDILQSEILDQSREHTGKCKDFARQLVQELSEIKAKLQVWDRRRHFRPYPISEDGEIARSETLADFWGAEDPAPKKPVDSKPKTQPVKPAQGDDQQPTQKKQVFSTTRAANEAHKHGLDHTEIQGTGSKGRITVKDVQRTVRERKKKA